MKCPNCNNELELRPYMMFKCNNCNKTFSGFMEVENKTLKLVEVFSVPKEGYKFKKKKSSFFYYELNKTEA